jgi:hypothetical protein
MLMYDAPNPVVMFVRTPFGPNTFTGLEVVRIEEASDSRGPALVRNTAPFTPLIRDLGQVNFSDPVVLIRGPFRISFSYAGPMHVEGHLARRSFPARFGRACVIPPPPGAWRYRRARSFRRLRGREGQSRSAFTVLGSEAEAADFADRIIAWRMPAPKTTNREAFLY